MASPGFLTQIPVSIPTTSDPEASSRSKDRSPCRRYSTSSSEDDDVVENSGRKLVAAEDQTHMATPQSSSDASIECIPIDNAASPMSDVIPLPPATPLSLLSHLAWARLPKSPPAARPMAHPVWRGRISKKQQAILDCDDSYKLPVAGKVARPGSVPLDIQRNLIMDADRLTHTTSWKNIAPQHSNSTAQVSLPQPHKPSPHPSPTRSAPSESDDDCPTQHASQWDSSPPQPPRRQAPPDTSPVHQPSPRNTSMRRLQESPLGSVTLAEQPLRPQEKAPSPSLPPSSRCPESSASQGRRATPSSPRSQISRPQNVIPSASTTVKALFRSTIHVKDTPLNSKEDNLPPHESLESETPISSFVAATYPRKTNGLAISQLENTYQMTQTPTVQNPGSMNHEIRVESTAEREETQSSEAPIEAEQERSKEPASRRSSVPAVVGGVVGGTVFRDDGEDILPEPKRRKIAPQPLGLPPLRDKAYMDIDRQRVLARRSFLRGISTGWANSGPDDPVAFVRQQIPSISRESSRSSSPHIPAKQSPPLVSTYEQSTATRLSIHDPSARQMRDSGSQKTSSVPEDRTALPRNQQIFHRFVGAYPDYTGTMRSFTTAVRLLLELRREGRELHPCLWDDFIFRMAHEYKRYLQTCITEDTNALSYQEYYHSQVRRPECQLGIIDEDAIYQITTDEERKPPRTIQAGYRSHSSSIVGHEQIKPPELYDASLVPSSKLKVALTKPREKDVPVEPPPSSAWTRRRAQADVSRRTSSLPGASQSVTLKKVRKLPWADNSSSAPLSDSMTYSQTPAEPPTTPTVAKCQTEKVESWLLTSRTSGAASPELEDRDLSPGNTQSLPPRTREARVQNCQDMSLSKTGFAEANQKQTLVLAKNGDNLVPGSAILAPRPSASPSFALFAKHYASLQSERVLDLNERGPKAVPVNIYEW